MSGGHRVGEPKDRAGQEPPASGAVGTAGMLEAWRATLLQRLIQYALALLLFAIVAIQLVANSQPLRPTLILLGGIAGLVLALSVDRSRTHLRACIYTLSTFGAATLGVLNNGLAIPNAYVATLAVVALLALAIGRRFAWFSLALFMLILAGLGWYFSVAGGPPANPRQDPENIGNWLRASAIFGGIGASLIAAVCFVTEKMESAMRHNEGLLRKLEQEGDNKLQALETQHKLEAQLRESHQLKSLGHLASGIAHDFNNLLVVILNSAHFAQQDWEKSNAPRSGDLDNLLEAGERAAALTKQLLTFGGGNVTERSRFDLSYAVTDSLRLLQRLLPANIGMIADTKQDVGTIYGSKVELDQIVFNLCVNARDAMPNGGTLSIKTRQVERLGPGDSTSRRFACLSVEDTGEGLTEEARLRLFEPFFTTKPEGQGTGLGLSVVHGAIQQHGGFVEVDSELGVGTSFRVFLPLSQGSRAQHSQPPPSTASVGGHESLLVVDDNDAVREIMLHLLGAAGYQVLESHNGAEALKVFEKHRSVIQLVITDSVMPEMGGRELYEAVHRLEPGVPFLFCSGYTSGSLPADFFDHPRRSLVPKPFRQKQLLDAVRLLLDAN